MENRLYLVLTVLILSGLVKANDEHIKKDSTEKRNPIINLFEAPLKAFQTKPGEAIAVFQPEIVRQAEQNDNQNSTNSWFNAGQSLGSQVSSLTGWLTNRLIQQTSTTPKPEEDVSVEVQQIKPNRNGNVNAGNGVKPGNGNNKPIRNIIRLRPILNNNQNNVKRRPFRPINQNKRQFIAAELDEHIIDLAEQQRIDNDRLDDDEEEYDDNLEELDDQENIKPVVNNRNKLVNRNQYFNRLRNGNINRNGNMNRVQNNQNKIHNQNMNRRRRLQQQLQKQRQEQNEKQPQRINRNQNRRPMKQQKQHNMQYNNNNNKMMRRPSNSGNNRGFNGNTRYNIVEDDDDDLDEDYVDDDLYDDSKNSDSNDYSDSNYDDYNNVKDKNEDNEDEYDDGDYDDLQTYEPIESKPQKSENVGNSGFRPYELFAVGGNGHIDRINEMNQRFPTSAIHRRQQLQQLQQQEEQKKQDQEQQQQQQLQQALLNQQHIIIPIHFIPDSIPYKEIAPQIVPQAQIQVVAEHHHTVQNAPNRHVVQQQQNQKQGNKNRLQNKNRSQNGNNRRPVHNINNDNMTSNKNQNTNKNKPSRRVTRTTTRKPQKKDDDVFYSVSLIAPGPTANRNQNMKTTKPTRRPPTIRNSPRSSPTPKTTQQKPTEDNFRGDLSLVSKVGMMQQQDHNRPDATPQSSDSDEMNDDQQTPPQYVAPAASPPLSGTDDDDDDDDDDELKPQGRTQFYLPQRYYQILGSDKYLAVSNKGRFLLKSARSLDLDKIKESDLENQAKVVEEKPEEKSVLELLKEPEVKGSEVKVEEIKEKMVEAPEIKEKEVKDEVEESTVKPQIAEELKTKKEEVKPIVEPVVEIVQPIDEHIKPANTDEEIDDGSWSTSTERPFVVKDEVEENKSSTVAPPLNKAGKVLLRSEIVQEKQNGGRFLVKSEQVKY